MMSAHCTNRQSINFPANSLLDALAEKEFSLLTLREKRRKPLVEKGFSRAISGCHGDFSLFFPRSRGRFAQRNGPLRRRSGPAPPQPSPASRRIAGEGADPRVSVRGEAGEDVTVPSVWVVNPFVGLGE